MVLPVLDFTLKMAVSFNSVLSLNSNLHKSCSRKIHAGESSFLAPVESQRTNSCRHYPLRVSVAKSDKAYLETKQTASGSLASSAGQVEISATTPSMSPTELGGAEETRGKNSPLTVREKLRAARVLSRNGAPKPRANRAKLGSSVLDALKESDKGKRSGLPEAPTNLLDDSKRGMPKDGLTFDLPGGRDLLVILFSFVFISTAMFATTYLVWKLGAIHFNEN